MNTTIEKPILKDLSEMVKAIRSISDKSYQDYTELRDYFRENKEEVKAILNRETIPSLGRYCFKDKKDRMVSSTYSALMGCFVLSGSYVVDVMNGETSEQARNKVFDKTTEADFEAWKENKQKERAEFRKAIDNPETLQEFQTFVRHKGADKLTTEQRARLDELKADQIRGQKDREQERKNEIAAVTLGGVDMILKESRHTKKNIPLWVVVLSSRVDRETYKELDNKAHRLGGYYSSYAKDGAIPGFTFENEEGARLFMQLKDGSVNRTELKKSEEEFKALSRIDQLKYKADRLEEEATEDLNQDRKDNTVKRAREASAAEARALGNIYFAKTLRKIAEAMQNGEIKYLDRLQNMTELSDLQSILNRAKWAYIREKGINENYFEMCPEVIDFVKYPFPAIWKENGLGIAYHAQHVSGRKLAAARWIKKLSKQPEKELYTVQGSAELQDFEIVFCTPFKQYPHEYSKFEAQRYIDDLQELNRMKRINIDTIEELRAALRELLRIKEGVSTDPKLKREQEIKELERQFVGKKIPGFFPTPADLAAEVVELADIQPGEKVAEPSAGLGHLAQVIRDKHPEADLLCIEHYSTLADALTLKGFKVLHSDFLAYEGKFDKIVMNPPFEELADIDHVLHAFECLNDGGRLVAIMAANKDGDREKVKNFRNLVEMFGEMHENEPGAFTSAFRPTGVNTITVILNKSRS